MVFRSAVISLTLAVVTVGCASAETRKTGLTVPVTYAGGTLPLSQGKIKATVEEDTVVLHRGSHKVSIPIQSITAISSGTDVRRRFGASVLGVVPRMHLDKAETHYVGLTWAGAEAVLKLNASEYRDFVAMLERLTGRKATDTRKTPTVVRYL
jgi:hypothetical protein